MASVPLAATPAALARLATIRDPAFIYVPMNAEDFRRTLTDTLRGLAETQIARAAMGLHCALDLTVDRVHRDALLECLAASGLDYLVAGDSSMTLTARIM